MSREERTKEFKKELIQMIREDEKTRNRRFVALVYKSRGTIDTLQRGNDVYEVDLDLPPFEMRYLREGDLFVFLDEDDYIVPDFAFPTILKAKNTPRKSNRSIISKKDEPFRVAFDVVPKSSLYIPENIFIDNSHHILSENKVKPKVVDDISTKLC